MTNQSKFKTITPIKKLKKGQIIVITSNTFNGNSAGTITKVISNLNNTQKSININSLEVEAKTITPQRYNNHILDHEPFRSTNSDNTAFINIWYEQHVRPATEREKRLYRKGIYHIDPDFDKKLLIT